MAKEPEPMYGSGKRPSLDTAIWPWVVMAIVVALVVYAIGEVEGAGSYSNIQKFQYGCEARWSDYGSRVLTVKSGDSTVLTCQVMVDGKWTPEANVKVIP